MTGSDRRASGDRRGRGATALALAAGVALALLAVRAGHAAVVRPLRDIATNAHQDFHSFFYGSTLVLDGRSYYDQGALTRLARTEGRPRAGRIPITTAPVFSTRPFMALTPLSYGSARIVWHAPTLVALAVAFLAIRTGLASASGPDWRPW